MTKLKLRLYLTGNTPTSERALINLKELMENELKTQYELEIIDILENPQLAEDEKIIATPTLLKQLPLPVRKIIGDLSNKETVLLGLDIKTIK